MMTQEEFMDVMAMKRQGLSIKEIAEETGYHPSTISGWLKNGGPPARRTSPNPPVIDELWSARIAELVRADPRLLATSVFELIAAEGYGGSYVSVARHLFELRGPVHRRTGGLHPDRHGTGRGVPVRLVRRLPLDEGVGTGRHPVLPGDPVVVPGEIASPMHRQPAKMGGSPGWPQ